MKQVFTRFSIVGASAFLSLAVGCASTEQTETLLSEAGFRSLIATDLSQRQLQLNLPRFDGHGNSKKERGPDGSKKERATGLYGAIQKPSSGDGDPQRQEFGADCARAWVQRNQSAWMKEAVLEAAAAGAN